MKTIAVVVALFACVMAASTKPKIYTEEEIEILAKFSRTLNERKNEFIDTETSLDVGRYCFAHSDCPPRWRCNSMLNALFDLLNATGHQSEMPRLKKKAKVYGKECTRPVEDVLNQFSVEELASRLIQIVIEINEILGSKDKGVAKYGLDVNALVTKKFKFAGIAGPMFRVGTETTQHPNSLLFLLFAMRSMDNNLKIDDSLLLTLALSSVQQPGTTVDNNLYNNPFLLFTLLGDKDKSSSSNVLLYSLLLSPGGLGSGSLSPENTLSNPLIILSLLEKNNNKLNIKDLLPLLISGGGFGTGVGAGAGGIQSILPLLLLSNSSLEGDKILPLLLLSGLGGGDPNAPGGLGGLQSILPLLLSSKGGLDSVKDILPLLLLGGGLGGPGSANPAALNSILPLLLLGNSSIGADKDFLLLLSLSGGLGPGTGGLGSLAPLLLLSSLGNSTSGGNSDLLGLLLLLGGGGLGGVGSNPLGGVGPVGPGSSIESILPLFLLLNSGSNNIMLLLYVFGFLTAVPDPLVVG